MTVYLFLSLRRLNPSKPPIAKIPPRMFDNIPESPPVFGNSLGVTLGVSLGVTVGFSIGL